MIGHLRIRSPWSQLLVLVLVFSPQIILLMVGLSLGNEVETSKSMDQVSVGTMKLMQAASSLLFFLLPAFLFSVFVFRGRYLYFLGFKPAEKTSMYVLSGIVMILALPFVFWLGELNRMIELPEWMIRMEQSTSKQMEEFLKVNHWYDVPVNILIIALLPAICEELFFRGALQRVMIHVSRSPIAGIILAAVLFSALHLQFAGFLPRFFLGMILGFLYWYSGSLWTSIIGHFVFNAIQVIWVSFAPKYVNENPSLPLLVALVSGVSIATILYFFRRQSTITYEKVYNIDELNPHNEFLA